ncbi:MAG: hypothetical protein CL568_05205 [Alphaproteobacteria bacterium]|jgi:hypothetical protein|nr:hypothetical protein [Alphaproteobacteria bacterium]PPR13629.1 MAG: hypothetical protein CFH42_01383 [Alphaproteobacteria bacterium MarineAlpha12_Bin1]|tara:strand:- start:6800 stop:7141 length:342 start_codon:yes stop_codon:yes gene_type:complete
MIEDRLPTELWVTAGLRRCNNEGIPATVVKKGEKQSGTVILKINQLDKNFKVFTQGRNVAGKLMWYPALNDKSVEESEADSYLERTASLDPDVWIIEIEHRDGWHPFEKGIFT